MEMLSEHQCQGWLEGYLLTGRHGFFSCYEAFIHIIDSMFNQHAKWLKVCKHIPWRRPIASLNYLLSSPRLAAGPQRVQPPGPRLHRSRRQQEGGGRFASTSRPTPTVCSRVTDHCLRSRNYVNVVVAGKQPAPQWLTMDQAVEHCTAGLGIWEWASNDKGGGAGCRHGLLRRRADAGDAGRRRSPSAARAGSAGPRDQRRESDEAAAGRASIPTACRTRSSTSCSPRTSRSSSPSTAIRG